MKLPVGTIKKILGEDLEEKLDLFFYHIVKVVHTRVLKTQTLYQNYKKAQELRRKGFTIDKMGRNTAMRFAKEEVELVEFSDAMLDKLAREFAPLKDKTISVQQANKLRMIFNKIPDRSF